MERVWADLVANGEHPQKGGWSSNLHSYLSNPPKWQPQIVERLMKQGREYLGQIKKTGFNKISVDALVIE